MRPVPRPSPLGIVALVAAGVLGGLAPIGAKYAIRELPPVTVLFLRLGVMLLALLPVTYRGLLAVRSQWKKFLVLGLCWTGNVTFFITGIGHTTTAISQLVYTLVPGIVLAAEHVLYGTPVPGVRIMGFFLALIGAVPFVYRAAPDGMGLGTPYGNVLMLMAAVSWAAYLLVSKRLSGRFASLTLTSASAVVAWVASFFLMAVSEGFGGIASLGALSPTGWLSLLFLGLVIGGVMIFLYQWGIARAPAVAAGSTAYIGILVGTAFGAALFGESVSPALVVSGALMCVGLYLTSVYKPTSGAPKRRK